MLCLFLIPVLQRLLAHLKNFQIGLMSSNKSSFLKTTYELTRLKKLRNRIETTRLNNKGHVKGMDYGNIIFIGSTHAI